MVLRESPSLAPLFAKAALTARGRGGELPSTVVRREGVELVLSANVGAARRDGGDYVLQLDDGRELSGDRLLVAPRLRMVAIDRCRSVT